MLVEPEHKPSDIDATSSNMLHYDLPAGLVVFLVALPLCLGIAIASGAPPFAGIIAGVVGGIIVGLLSGSPLSVSGPSAGLAVMVAGAIQLAGSYRGFLAILLMAGAIQFVFGLLRLGALANYLPNSVIRGMLAATGIVIILKQIPHALGRDLDYEGDFSFLEPGGSTTFSDIANSVMSVFGGAVAIFAISLVLLLLWEKLSRRLRFFQYVPGALVAVVAGIGVNSLFGGMAPGLQIITPEHLVSLPAPTSLEAFFLQFAVPDFTAIGNLKALGTAAILAMVASVESLISLEAADRLDPYKRISSPNRELCAQGIGNIVSGMLGGLPVTSSVIRTSANAYSCSRTRISAIAQGVLLAGLTFFAPHLLMMVPLASLAALLIVIGYKLTAPAIYKEVYGLGWAQFVPFAVTVFAVVFTDLMTGVIVGFACGVFFVFRQNHHEAITVVNDGNDYLLRFTKDASFVNKNEFRTRLRRLPAGSRVFIDGTKALYIDNDILDVVEDFKKLAPYRNIEIDLKHWKSQGRG
jgi:MFS superfamily sulfate permease-like transporter